MLLSEANSPHVSRIFDRENTIEEKSLLDFLSAAEVSDAHEIQLDLFLVRNSYQK